MTSRRPRQGRYDARKVLDLGIRLCVNRGELASASNIAKHLGVSEREVVRWRTGACRSAHGPTVDRIETFTGVHVGHFERIGAPA